MKEPVRWQDDGSVDPDVRALLRQAAPPPPVDPEAHRAVMAFAASLGATKAAAATGTIALGAKVVMGLLVVGAATGAGLWAMDRPSVPPPVSSSTPSAPLSPSVERSRTEGQLEAVVEHEAEELVADAPEPVEVPSLEPPPRVESVARPRGVSREALDPAPAPRVVEAERVEDGLVREAALLEQARSAVAADPARALALTEAHRRDHAVGQLAAERELIAIDALLRLGRSEEAARRARALVERAPRGIHARRAERMLERAEQLP